MRKSFLKRYVKIDLSTKEPTYENIHGWLRKTFGKADICENYKCDCLSPSFDWALKKSKHHAFKRKHYIKLCRKCHHAYDNKSKKGWITRNKQR